MMVAFLLPGHRERFSGRDQKKVDFLNAGTVPLPPES
jgi:hypothetical protein